MVKDAFGKEGGVFIVKGKFVGVIIKTLKVVRRVVPNLLDGSGDKPRSDAFEHLWRVDDENVGEVVRMGELKMGDGGVGWMVKSCCGETCVDANAFEFRDVCMKKSFELGTFGRS